MRDKLKYLPRAYAFPKDKNLEKGRPIVPYRKHGLRRVLQAAARALLYVVEKTGGGWPTGNIYTENMHRLGENTNTNQ